MGPLDADVIVIIVAATAPIKAINLLPFSWNQKAIQKGSMAAPKVPARIGWLNGP
jgi:hypothetical protein